MGEEIIDFILKAQRIYGVQIPETYVPLIITIGDLYEHIVEQSGQTPSSCASSFAFYRFRHFLGALTGLDRLAIRPATSLSTIIPFVGRKSVWTALQRELKWCLPALRRPLWLYPVFSISTLALFAYSFSGWTRVAGVSFAGVVGFFAFFLIFILPVFVLVAYYMSMPLARVFPIYCKTVRDAINCIISLNYYKLSNDNIIRPNKNEIWDSLCCLAADHFAVKPESLSRNTEFVRDLGAD